MDTRVDRWERVAQLPLTFASILFVGAHAGPIINTELAVGLMFLGIGCWVW